MFGTLECHCDTAPWLASWHISGTLCRGLVRWRGALPVGAHRIIEVVPSCKLLLHLFSGTEKVFTRGVPYATQMPIVLQLNSPYRSWQHSLPSCVTKLRELLARRRYFLLNYYRILLETFFIAHAQKQKHRQCEWFCSYVYVECCGKSTKQVYSSSYNWSVLHWPLLFFL